MQEIEYFEVESEKRSWSARKTAFCQGNASNKKQRIGNVSVLSASGCHGTLVLREVLLWKAQPTDLWLALKKVIILLPCQVSWAQMFWKKKRHKRKKRGEEHDACVFPSAIVKLLFWPVKEHQYLQKSMKKWVYSRNLVQFTKQIFIRPAGRHTALWTGTDEATVCWSQLGEFTSALYVTEWEIIICNEN